VTTVIADTGPVNYLIQIGEIGVLPRVFGSVLVPNAVADELSHPRAPMAVRGWIAAPPPWLIISSAQPVSDAFYPELGRGERHLLALAGSLGTDLLLLMDDRAAITVAASLGFGSLGTLGVLIRAAQRGLIDLSSAFERLKATSFRVRPSLLAELLNWHRPDPLPQP